jgi:hypothetical protein
VRAGGSRIRYRNKGKKWRFLEFGEIASVKSIIIAVLKKRKK